MAIGRVVGVWFVGGAGFKRVWFVGGAGFKRAWVVGGAGLKRAWVVGGAGFKRVWVVGGPSAWVQKGIGVGGLGCGWDKGVGGVLGSRWVWLGSHGWSYWLYSLQGSDRKSPQVDSFRRHSH